MIVCAGDYITMYCLCCPTHHEAAEGRTQPYTPQSTWLCPTYRRAAECRSLPYVYAGQQSAGRSPTHGRAAECRTHPYTPSGSRVQDGALHASGQQTAGRCPTHRRAAEHRTLPYAPQGSRVHGLSCPASPTDTQYHRRSNTELSSVASLWLVTGWLVFSHPAIWQPLASHLPAIWLPAARKRQSSAAICLPPASNLPASPNYPPIIF